MQQVRRKQRRAHAEEKDQPRIMAAPAPESDRRPNRGAKENRVQQAQFGAEKLAQVPEGGVPRTIGARAFGQVADGDPFMLVVPNQHRQRA